MHESNGSVRIGVYVCHCGFNIASVIDVEAAAQSALSLPCVVVARDYKYMCSEPGQTMIEQDIVEHKLNRIVVAACSPLLHEDTFRNAAERAGINKFFVQMVNVREHGAWVHEDREAATRKAIDLIRAAVGRVYFHKALTPKRVPINPAVMVVGAGISGIHAAITIANSGKRVYLVEREPTIGGNMARYDKTFPTLDCAACILTPKMNAVRSHPNITLWTYSEVAEVEGYVGSYKVKVRRKPRYIKEDLCVGCLHCVDACVFKDPKFPDTFNMGMDKRKPIYLAFAQATPKVVVIDPDACIQLKTGKCKQSCAAACERGGVSFDMTEEIEEVEVGSIIVATGFEPFDATEAPEYGYGIYPNVYTTMEIERLVNASGPTGGEVIMRDGTRPKSIGVIYCVGSRDERHNRWCSRVCCMTALKLSHLLKEHTDAELYNFYIDMRAAGKGYEEFYQRILNERVHFIRGKVAEVCEWALDKSEEGKLVIRVEDTLTGFVRRVPVDMVVLAVGLEPRSDAQDVRRIMNMSCSTEGFFLERHPKLAPAPTYTDGVYIAGCCQGPKDIPDTVMQAGYAAAEAMALADIGYFELEPNTAEVIADECSGCKSCVPLCPYHAIAYNEVKHKAEINPVLCKGCGVCVSSCPSGSIRQDLFEDEEIYSEIKGILAIA
ncbi:MAG: CoB--CoM heterodisulfide reductase iron-sulfur subunit A family protein [Armatimonadetes bacterium]|nr:CoB--CoM heterodisulfide reductase iron-sulfur subunit A family protein [Armatimonadota bacterium]